MENEVARNVQGATLHYLEIISVFTENRKECLDEWIRFEK